MNTGSGRIWGAVVLAVACLGCGKTGPRVAYVTNGIADFWLIGQKGAEDAAAKHGVTVEVRMPAKGADDQKKIVQDLLAQGVQGIAISPIDAANQVELLDEIAASALLITQDSDAPKSKRLCYIGVDNYDAGRLCGKLVKEAVPQGGGVMLFIGRLGQDNARLRRQGVIDELLDRSVDPTRYDQPGTEVVGEKYTILDTRTDDFDFNKAKSLAEQSLADMKSYSKPLVCMVGLFAYNPPKLLEAVREATKDGHLAPGQVKIVGFDEDGDTLAGIESGEVHGTVVQDPYQYGFESVRILAGLVKGDKSVLPPGGMLAIPPRKVVKANVVEFRDNLAKLLGKDEKEPAPAATGN